MKKVAFMFVAAMALSFAACGGQTKASEEACDSAACCDSAAVVEEVVDTLAEVVDSAAAEVQAEAVVAE
jgi:hypothetical protein